MEGQAHLQDNNHQMHCSTEMHVRQSVDPFTHRAMLWANRMGMRDGFAEGFLGKCHIRVAPVAIA